MFERIVKLFKKRELPALPPPEREPIRHEPISDRTREKLDEMRQAIKLGWDFNPWEQSIIADRHAACIKYGDKAVMTQNQLKKINEIYAKWRRRYEERARA